MKYIVTDHTRENEQRLRRAQLLKRSQKLNKNELWQGIFLSIMVGLSIAVILFCWAFPALSYAIDNIPPGIATIIIFGLLLVLAISWSIVREGRKAGEIRSGKAERG